MANDSDMPQSEGERPVSDFDSRGPRGTNTSQPGFGRLALCMAAAGALAFGVFATVAYGVWFNHDQQRYGEAIASARQALGMPVSASAAASGAAAGRLVQPVALMEPASSAAVAGIPSTNTITTAPAVSTPAIAGAVGSAALAASIVAPTSNAPATITPTGSQTIATPPSTSEASLVSDGEEGSKQAVWSGQVARAPAEAAPRTALVTATAATAPTPPTPSPRSTRRTASSPDLTAQQSAAGRTGKDARPAQPERRASLANAQHKNSLFARMGLFFRRVSYRQHDTGRQQQDIYSHP